MWVEMVGGVSAIHKTGWVWVRGARVHGAWGVGVVGGWGGGGGGGRGGGVGGEGQGIGLWGTHNDASNLGLGLLRASNPDRMACARRQSGGVWELVVKDSGGAGGLRVVGTPVLPVPAQPSRKGVGPWLRDSARAQARKHFSAP